jgi:hypothetical protein
MTTDKGTDQEVATLFSEVRNRFAQAASWYPETGIKELFNRSVEAIDAATAAPGDFTNPAKAQNAREACLLIAYMEDDALRTHDSDVINEFAQAKPTLERIQKLVGR